MFVKEHICGLCGVVKIFCKKFRLAFGSGQKVRVKVIWEYIIQMNSLRRNNWSLLSIYICISIYLYVYRYKRIKICVKYLSNRPLQTRFISNDNHCAL